MDFMRKGFLEEAPPPPPPPPTSSSGYGDGPAPHPHVNVHGGMMSEDMQRERERQSWEAGVTAAHNAELELEERRQERKEAILDINKETRDERDRTHSLRDRRAAQVRAECRDALLLLRHTAHTAATGGVNCSWPPREGRFPPTIPL